MQSGRMGEKRRKKEETRIRNKMAALLDHARLSGDDVSAAASVQADTKLTHNPKLRKTRGPQKAPRKQPVSIRLDADLVTELRAGGKGWQTRVNTILRKALGLQD